MVALVGLFSYFIVLVLNWVCYLFMVVFLMLFRLCLLNGLFTGVFGC